MFTRIVELTTKPGKNKQLSDTINDKVLPILKKQGSSPKSVISIPRVAAVWHSSDK